MVPPNSMSPKGWLCRRVIFTTSRLISYRSQGQSWNALLGLLRSPAPSEQPSINGRFGSGTNLYGVDESCRPTPRSHLASRPAQPTQHYLSTFGPGSLWLWRLCGAADKGALHTSACRATIGGRLKWAEPPGRAWRGELPRQP